jgi:light-regulated signal transduction histidine kinase (bacteriophytochrome)
MSIPDELMEQMKASEALAALLAKHIPPRDIPRVARLLYEVDHLGVAAILEQAVRARPAIRAHIVTAMP